MKLEHLPVTAQRVLDSIEFFNYGKHNNKTIVAKTVIRLPTGEMRQHLQLENGQIIILNERNEQAPEFSDAELYRKFDK